MPKIAIATDTNSGLDLEEAKKEGIYILPMPFVIDSVEYFEGKDISTDFFYYRQKEGASINTSQPAPADVLNLWDKLLKEYDQVVYIPMSSALSSSYQTARLLAQEYEDRVFPVDNQCISVTQLQSARTALKMAESGKYDGAQIKDFLEKTAHDNTIYIMLTTLTYLKKGGRITPAAAAIGSLLRIKPVLQIQGGKLDAFAKARTVNQGKNIMIQALKTDIENRFGGSAENLHMFIAHTDNATEAENFKNELKDVFPGNDISIYKLPLSIACHIGPGSLALAASKKQEV